MNAIARLMRPTAMLISIFLAHHAAAIVDPDNLGQWTKPTTIGPDQKVPGFLINLGPTGARATLQESSFVVKHVFAGSPADGQLEIDDEITDVNDKGFAKHTFGKFYGMNYEVGYEGPVMDLGNAIEDSEGSDGTLKLDVIRGGKPLGVKVKLPAIGRFSDSYPLNCPKSAKLTADATDYLINQTADFTGQIHEQGKVGLALLAQGKMKEAGELAEDCGIEVDQKHLDLAYACIHEHTHESGYMGYRFATGAYTPVGRQGLHHA